MTVFSLCLFTLTVTCLVLKKILMSKLEIMPTSSSSPTVSINQVHQGAPTV